MSPSPNWSHQEIVTNIAYLLSHYVRANDIGKVLVSPMDVVLNETNVYQPDVLFFHHKRNLLGRRAVEGAPDFVVEILSESTAHLDRDLKRKIYARSGVKELWFIEPETKEIEVYHLQKSVNKLHSTYSASDSFTSKMFPGLTFSGAEIFRGV
jgi:Uma2 family endonuclease